MSRKKCKKEIFIYIIIYDFLYVVDTYVSPLYLGEKRFLFIDWKLGIKRDFLGWILE